jgi:hypothetical protein
VVQGHYHIILTPFVLVPSWVLGFSSMTMLFYWLIILNNIILMIDNDQSTIIEARPSPLTLPPTSKYLWWTCYGQFYWTKLSGYHIHTKYCTFDHSEMIFGPLEKMTFYGEHPRNFSSVFSLLIHQSWKSSGIALLSLGEASYSSSTSTMQAPILMQPPLVY